MAAIRAAIKRTLHKGDKGPDVKALQRSVGYELIHLDLRWLRPKFDGTFGKQSVIASAHAAYALGFTDAARKKIRAGTVDGRSQRLLRHPRNRGPIMRVRALARRGELRKWRKAHRKPTPPPPTQHVEQFIDFLISKHMPYVWGGGRTASSFNGPGDCSWFAGRVWDFLTGGHEIGTTFTEAGWGEAGEGKLLTLHIFNADPSNAHVIISLKTPHGVRWAECGGSDNPTPGGGPTWFHPSPGRIAHFSIKRHPKGF